MRTVYFSSFLLGQSVDQAPSEISSVAPIVEDWLFSREILQKPSQFDIFSNDSYIFDEDTKIITRNFSFGDGNEEILIFAVRLEHPEKPSEKRHWRADVVISRQPEPISQLRASVSISVGASDENLAPLYMSPSRPRIVPELIRTFGARDNLPIIINHIDINENDIEEFKTLLVNPERHIPLIAISRENSTNDILTSPPRVADRLAGLAYVCTFSSPNVSYALREALGNSLNVYNGAIRIYWPGFSETDPPYKHRFWSPERVLEGESRPGGFCVDLLRFVSSISATRRIEAPCRWDDVDRLYGSVLRKSLKSSGDYEELVNLSDSVIEDLEGQVRELQREKEELEQNLAAKEAEADQWRIAYQDVRKSPGRSISVDLDGETQAIDTVESAISVANNQFSEKIYIAKNRIDDLAYSFSRPDILYDAFRWIATTYIDAKMGRRPCSNLDLSARNECGCQYSGGQSDVTMGKYKNEYYMDWNGESRVLGEHLKYGTGRDPRYNIRIAFFFDNSEEKVVIGYIGQHQKTSSS